MPRKADKRKEQYMNANLQSAEALANEIQRMKEAKEELDLEKTNNLIQLYINMGKEMGEEYKASKNDQEKTMLYDKLAKKFTKDYTALLKYKKHLESLAKLDEKKSSKSKKNISVDPNKTNYLDIESFYESTRTRTITVSEEEMEKLEVATNSSNIRYKVPFIVEDEPIEGKKKGDSCIGYFTKAESYDTDDKDTIMELKAKAKRKLLAKKYPEAADFLEEIEYKKFIQMKYSTDEADALNAFTVLTDKPYQFGLNRNRDKSKTYILEWMNKSEASDEDKDRCKEDLDRMDSDQKFMAYVEYMNYLLEVEGALTVREVNGIKFGVDTSERNALTSVFADILGCSQNIAFSEKMKIKTKKDGKDVVIKGVVMMPAKGLDILKEGIGSPLAKMDGMSFEKSPGLVKNIASIQFLDFIIRNPDRFAYNVFFNLNKDSKLTEVQGIDNDTTFTAIDNRNLLSWSKLGVIPKSMADKIKAIDTNMLSILMRGYGLSDVEIEKVVEGVNTAKEKIASSEERYAGKDPRYIEFGVPRILPDKDMDKLSINGQLVRQHGLFERLIEQGDKEIQRGDLYDNDYDKCGILAKENIEVYLSALKYGMNEINNNNVENLKFREEGAETLNDKYNAMKTEYQKIDVMYETEVPGFRFISTSMEHSNFVFNYHNKYKDLKETVSNALEKTEEFISAMTEDIYENGGKYEEYQTLKAERDYYKKEYSKDGEISAENIQNLKDMDEEIKTLEDTPEIKAINAAIKNRESLQKMVDNFNKVETLTKKLKGEVKKLDKFRDAVMDDHKLANSYEGSSLEKENNKMNKRFDEMYDEIKIFQRQMGIK